MTPGVSGLHGRIKAALGSVSGCCLDDEHDVEHVTLAISDSLAPNKDNPMSSIASLITDVALAGGYSVTISTIGKRRLSVEVL